MDHFLLKRPQPVQSLVMLMTIDADSVTSLRHLVMRTCGTSVVYIRIQPITHATRMKVWLGLKAPASGLIMDAVMRHLPDAEFGQVTPG
ncbi:hypothetical protein [Paraherbaspirillum soli]|uniref:Uncharacterized protein n=1 Tax=Paraherbaspirillum soli TaxID=631222 RepID=A0ABW0M3P8_9BURK